MRCLSENESKAKQEMSQQQSAPAAQEQQEHASDLLEKARNRFDKFWGKSPEQ